MTSKSRFASILDRDRADQEESPAVKLRERRAGGKSSDPDYVQISAYIRKETHKATRKLLLDEDKDMSELVEELLHQWVSSRS